jgi:nitroreductase
VPELDVATVDHLLTSTRAVRKRLDLARAVRPEVIEECLRLAIQAPTGGNSQGWRWVVVTDAGKRAALADIYRKGFYPYLEMRAAEAAAAPADATMDRVRGSSVYLADRLHEVPVHVIPCVKGRDLSAAGNAGAAGLYGSIFPAVWSFQLALRSRGLGSALTTLHLLHEGEAAELLGIPDDYLQVALLPVAYFTGHDFKPAPRRPVEEITYWDAWKQRRS